MVEYRVLGKPDIRVSVVGLGCWPFAGGVEGAGRSEWGHQDERDSLNTVAAALDAGINLFDTAEGYGCSEEVLGKALSGHRHQAVIATKVSPNHLTADEVPKACEASLARLRTDYIDLYQIHWPNRSVPIAETMTALEKLRTQGKIRAIGVCNMGVHDLTDLLAAGHCETDQISYSLIWRVSEREIQSCCRENGIGIICWGPLMEGLLTGKFGTPDDFPLTRARTRHFSKSRPMTVHGESGQEEETFAAIDRVRRIAAGIGQPMAAVSIAWLLHQPGVTTVLAGSRRPDQILQNVQAAELRLSPEIVQELADATEELKRRFGSNQCMYSPAESTPIR